MGYLCARCKKDIANDVKRFLGTTYCPECCAAAIATPPYSPQSGTLFV